MMKINRQNYEEYFILYMDNELSVEDRRMVDDFIQLHPDLKDELSLLLQYKLDPDTNIIYPGKEELIKPNGASQISVANYEEWFVQYVDDELSPVQKKETEDFIAENPSLQKELDWMMKTKLQPEEIRLPDKSILFRKEQRAKILPIYWRRIAVAAVLILGIGFATYTALNKKSGPATKEDIATKDDPANQPGKTNEVIKTQELPIPGNSLAVENPTENNLAENGSNVQEIPVPQVSNTNNITSNSLSNQDQKRLIVQPVSNHETPIEIPAIATNKPSNNLPLPDKNPNVIALNSTKESVNNVNEENNTVTNQSTAPSDIKHASIKDNDVAFEETDGKKNKLRGFFRKLTRTFEKRTDIDPTDDDKLLVAGLAIKLK